jgi:hypothetical protein
VYQNNSGLFSKSFNCACNTELHYYLTKDGANDGHTWFENPSSVLNATEMLLSFFAKYTNTNCILTNTKKLPVLPEIEIFPNPASNHVLIDRKKNESVSLNISVYNSHGNLVKWIKANHFPYLLKTEDFTTGNYFFHISDGKNIFVKKVFIFK